MTNLDEISKVAQDSKEFDQKLTDLKRQVKNLEGVHSELKSALLNLYREESKKVGD